MIDEDNTTDVVNDTALPETEGEQNQQEQQDSVEDRARRMGWTDKEHFKGPEHRWVPADEYVANAEEKLPVMRAQLHRFEEDNKRYEKTVDDLRSELTGMRKDFQDFHKHYKNVEEQSYERARQELWQVMENSAGEADVDTFRAARQRLTEIDKHLEERKQPIEQPAEQKQEQAQPKVSEAVQEFLAANPWFNTDPMLNGAMIQAHQVVMAEMAGRPEREQLQESKRRLMERFPNEFPETRQTQKSNPLRNEAAAVSSSNNSANGRQAKREKSFDELPDDAKAQYQRFAQKIPGYTKEEYVKSYSWE